MAKLDRKNIAVSNGSACNTGNVKPSAVLMEMGVKDDLNLSTVRISFGHNNNKKGYESGGKYGGKGVKEFARLKSIYLKDKELLRTIKNPSKGDKNKYDHYLAIASATNIINEIMPIIKEWFNKNNTGDKGNTNKLVRLLFQIATSRSPLSSRFVIAK